MSISTTTNHHAGRCRVRPLAGLAVAAVMTTAGLALPSPAHATALDVPEDCAQPFPESSLTNGQPVHGLTVTTGTDPTSGEFTGKVLGTLKDGIAPGIDMILVELHSDAIDTNGIWEGMSGSPVYASNTADGTGTPDKLLGAVSYSLSFGKSNIAGVTPFAAMQRYLPSASGATTAPNQVPLASAPLARKVATAAGVSPSDAAQGMSELPTPLSIAGIPASRVAKAQRSGKPWLSHALATRRMGAPTGGVEQANPADLAAGGNLTAALVYGDVVEAGIGTVTSVCHGSLVGFGHPMMASGPSSMTLMSADAVTIQPDPLGSAFKVANIGGIAGTITQDRFAGISGPLNGGPAAATFTAASRYGTSAHTGRSFSSVGDASADAAFFQLTASNDAALDAVHKGGAQLTFTVRGTDPAGRPFTITHGDRYASPYDISYDSAWDVGDLVYALSQIPGVHITSVSATNALDDVSTGRTLKGVQQRVRGKWLTVSERMPVFARPGRQTVLRLVLAGSGGTTYKTATLAVPRRFKSGSGQLTFIGGNDFYDDFSEVQSVPQAINRVKAMVRNDAVQFHVKLRKRAQRINRKLVISGIGQVVDGEAMIPVMIARR